MGCVDSLEPKRNWAQLSRQVVAAVYEPCVLASCPTLAQVDRTVFPEEPTFRQIRRPWAWSCPPLQGMDAPEHLARALSLVQKGTSGFIPQAVSWSATLQTWANHHPRCTPAPWAACLASAALRTASSILHPVDELPSKQVLSNKVYPLWFFITFSSY